MDEIEYKLNTNNSVLIVNAIDKLIYTIKSKFKPSERQKFVLENEELKFLRDKCSSKDPTVSLTACQGLLALVELGVLEIAHTMSTVVTLLPSAHNYSAIISTMAGLLILDLKSRLGPGHQYKCQFSLKTPQHPFITVLEKNKGAEEYVLTQMHALCTHPDYVVSSNSLELLRPVFLWLTCNPQRDCGIRPWQLLLSLPQSTAQSSLLLACLSCQQICNPALIDRSFAAYSAVADAAIYQGNWELVTALLPMLARISNELISHGRDPRACYHLVERCAAREAAGQRAAAGLALAALAGNLPASPALHLHELFNLCLNIISKYEISSISLNIFIALSLQWLHLPSYLTSSALKVASKLLDIYRDNTKEDNRLHMPNLKANKTFQTLLYTNSHLSVIFKLTQNWERLRDNKDGLISWLDSIERVDNSLKLELLPFLLGILFEKKQEVWFEEVVLKVLRVAVDLVDFKKDLSVQLLPILLYMIANDRRPSVRWECLKALPLMAKTKENVPTIVSILNKLKANKGVPTSFLILLYTSLAETQVRCFPYLQELLVEAGAARADDIKWEVDVARALAVRRVCEIRPSSHGLELVSVISSMLNRCGDKAGAASSACCVAALARLWAAHALAPRAAWAALEPRLGRDTRPIVQISICKLLSEVPALRVAGAEFDKLASEAARKLWAYIAESNQPAVVEAACDALAAYRIEDYTLKDIPEIYRKMVKLPAAYCKTPADAARKPEDVLDYVPCEVWPEVFRYTNQAALSGVESLAGKLVEREVRGYRSGVYQLEGRPEPAGLAHLPATSVARGLMDCLRKQATSPCYDFPVAALAGVSRALAAPTRPLPPSELQWARELAARGPALRGAALALCARQAQVAASARRVADTFLDDIVRGDAEESDVTLMFEILPTLCRSMPPNSLRGPLQKCLAESFGQVAHVKARSKAAEGQEFLFISQMEMIRQCLECERIHDANRTLLSQIVEGFMVEISDDNVAWPTYVQTCLRLSTMYIERMSSPSGWWEVTSELVRKACSLRCAMAQLPDCSAPLVWLNEIIDAQATHITERESSLRCMAAALAAAPAAAATRGWLLQLMARTQVAFNDERESSLRCMAAALAAAPAAAATRGWLLQLMARTQVAFNEMEDKSGKLYLCDVFMLSVIVFSGHWCLEAGEGAGGGRAGRLALLPAAAAALAARPDWSDCTSQLLEWLCHTRDSIPDAGAARGCQRALLAMRHTDHFATHKIWTRLESHFGQDMIEE